MEKTETRCGTAVAVLACVVLLGLLAVNWPEQPPDWPAWAGIFQAFGTVIAIWWTYRTTRDQFESERKDRDAERTERKAEAQRALDSQLETIIAIAIDAVEALVEFQNKTSLSGDRNGLFGAVRNRLEDAQFGLRSLLSRDLPSGAAANLLNMQRGVSRCLRTCQEYLENGNSPIDFNTIWARVVTGYRDATQLNGFCEAWELVQASRVLRLALHVPPTQERVELAEAKAIFRSHSLISPSKKPLKDLLPEENEHR